MQQTGIVREIHGGARPHSGNNAIIVTSAEVEITRSSACGESCASCGLCPGQTARIYAINDVNAKAGDTVIIDMSDKKVLGAAFLVYIVPLIMLIAGYFSGYALFKSDGIAILTGFIFMAVTFILLMRTDRKLKRRYTPHIISIVNKETEI